MDNENILGEITCESQGVHVLKTLDNGWSYVEVPTAAMDLIVKKEGLG